MEEMITPYELPEIKDHSFFFIDQRIATHIEAKLHKHDAWELYHVIHGHGNAPTSADNDGCIHYLMVAFSHSLITRCIEVFPELRNRLTSLTFPVNALKYGLESSRVICKMLSQMNDMDDLGRLSAMFRLLPVIFNSSDHILAGKPMQIERDVRRMQQICAYVMAHYVHTITLNEIASEVGMNRSAFCSYFKRCKKMTFSQFVTQYRLNTACELLKHSQKQVSEICFAVGFNDVPHFNRVFKELQGMTPKEYRKRNI